MAAADGEKGAAAAEMGVTGGKMITLRSNDVEPFEVEVTEAAARLSGLLGQMIESDSTAGGVTLPKVATATLEKVVEYLNKHSEPADDRSAARASGDADKELKRWDARFVDGLASQDHDALFDLILAADYLVIDDLLDAACKKIADMMKGKTPEKIRATFNIQDDYTEEEKEEMREEYAWAFPKDHRSSASTTDDD